MYDVLPQKKKTINNKQRDHSKDQMNKSFDYEKTVRELTRPRASRKGKEPELRNRNAIFGSTRGAYRICRITIQEAIPSSVYSLKGAGGTQTDIPLQVFEET